MRGRVAHVPNTIVTTHPFTDGRDDIYGGPQAASGYGKGRDDHGQQQNVMPAEWVRNKHLGKKGEFRYF